MAKLSQRAGAAASWMALLASTTMGLDHYGRVRAQISADGLEPGRNYRLVAQAYPAGSVRSGTLPDGRARPLGSAQRSITAEQLRSGVALDIVQLGDDAGACETSVVLAWVEPGEPDLEYDARRARPGPEAVVAVGRVRVESGPGETSVVMNLRTA
ncbi:MAG: hypothetical protein JW940_39625 [Polyangiaceae bacterium]|nr:hypothetical protein [Polyangiaceae bacterium]